MYSMVTEDDVIGQNIYDFLLLFYSNFGRISSFLCFGRFYAE